MHRMQFHRRLRAALATFLVVLTLLMIASTAASAVDAPAGPAWLREGTLLSFTWSAMAVESRLKVDPTGGWCDAVTGRHYSPAQGDGTSGSGWSEALISAIDHDNVVLSTSAFSDVRLVGPKVPVPQMGTGGFVTDVKTANDYWMLPATLAAQRSDPAAGVLVTAEPWKVGRETVDGVRIIAIRGNTYLEHVYDRKTGLCVHVASIGVTEPPKNLTAGGSRRGMTLYVETNLIGIRELKLPWAGLPIPEAVKKLGKLHFEGTAALPPAAIPVAPVPISIDMKVAARGDGWVTVTSVLATHFPNMPALPPVESSIAYGHHQIHGLWISPEALSKLREGQAIDDDPLTTMKTVVAEVGAANVVIVSRSAGGEVASEYDRASGILMAYRFYDGLTKQTWTVRRQE